MGKNQNSVLVLQIRLKFWWMIPMVVKYNHTKYMAQEAIPRAPTPPTTPHFLWFPSLKIAQTDA